MDAPIKVDAANTVDPRFVFERQGKSVVLYQGLLDLAHRQGLKAIRTRLIQVPGPDNGQVAICSAEVETDKGLFTGIGDASPTNVARPMLNATIRFAETRAKARALRDAVNVGVVSFEELDGETGELTAQAIQNGQRSTAGDSLTDAPVVGRPSPTPIRPVAANGPRPATATASAPASHSAQATDAQLRAIYSIAAEQGLSKEDVVKFTGRHYTSTPENLTRKQASETIETLKQGAKTNR